MNSCTAILPMVASLAGVLDVVAGFDPCGTQKSSPADRDPGKCDTSPRDVIECAGMGTGGVGRRRALAGAVLATGTMGLMLAIAASALTAGFSAHGCGAKWAGA